MNFRKNDIVSYQGNEYKVQKATYGDYYLYIEVPNGRFNKTFRLTKIESELKMVQPYYPKIEYMGATATVVSSVFNDGTLIYLELVGQEDKVKSVTSVLMQGRIKMNKHEVRYDQFFKINKAGNKRVMQTLPNGTVHAILYHAPSIKEVNFNTLLARDEDELVEAFGNWMELTNPFPYPKELLGDIFSELQSKSMLEELDCFGIKAYSLKESIMDDEYAILRDVILDVSVRAGVANKYDESKIPKKDMPLPKSTYLIQSQVKDIFETLKKMPKTYELNDIDIKPVGLKLFSPDRTIYITEADRGSEDDEYKNMHTQCYGYTENLSDPGLSEWGYVSVPELLKIVYPGGAGFEKELGFKDMYINSKGNVAKKEILEQFAQKAA